MNLFDEDETPEELGEFGLIERKQVSSIKIVTLIFPGSGMIVLP